VTIADFRHLPAARPFMVLVPQWDFLDFLAAEARKLPNFTLRMGAKAEGVIDEDGRVRGVRVQERGRSYAIRCDLLVGADGRHTTIRESARLATVEVGAPIDVLWFRLSRRPGDPSRTGGIIQPGALLVTLNRESYWQCAFVIPKGALEPLRARGLPAFRERVAQTAPFLTEAAAELRDWEQVKLLSVQIDYMPTWWREGLLCIGDAAHAMSPVGGVGINLAIQDAVAAANLLAAPLLRRELRAEHLEAVQKRRLWPARFVQRLQVAVQDEVLSPALARQQAPADVPLPVKLLQRLPLLRRIPARVIGLGVRPERVRLPARDR
jgi:2-polyprenyl-6-methoxyphenol hydroxylase-like FAD-dependent oxidoreductase